MLQSSSFLRAQIRQDWNPFASPPLCFLVSPCLNFPLDYRPLEATHMAYVRVIVHTNNLKSFQYNWGFIISVLYILNYYDIHFINVETEAWKSYVNFPSIHSQRGADWVLNPHRLVSWSLLFATSHQLGWMGKWEGRLAGYYIYYWHLYL